MLTLHPKALHPGLVLDEVNENARRNRRFRTFL